MRRTDLIACSPPSIQAGLRRRVAQIQEYLITKRAGRKDDDIEGELYEISMTPNVSVSKILACKEIGQSNSSSREHCRSPVC